MHTHKTTRTNGATARHERATRTDARVFSSSVVTAVPVCDFFFPSLQVAQAHSHADRYHKKTKKKQKIIEETRGG